MRYENGKDLFPEELLRQIQNYAAGKLVYIPTGDSKRQWGETSGYKRFLAERDRKIKNSFKSGTTIGELADEYSLSVDSIKKIVYTKKEVVILDYKCTLSSAMAYSADQKLEEWVHTYLLSDGNNREFSYGLKQFDRFYIGPIKMPLNLFQRCCGPEEDMKFRIDGTWFEQHVNALMETLKKEKDMPPLIVHYTHNGFELNDGNHRHEAYTRLGIDEYYVIVWITEKSEYDAFTEKYSKYLK